MISKKKAAKKPQPAKRTSKPTQQAPKRSPKKKSNSSKGSKPMTELNQSTTASQTSVVETLLADIASKLGELVAIETYLANKVAEAPKQIATAAAPIATPVAASSVVAAPAQSIPAVPAPAQPSQPTAPPSRPGSGTIGGLVWDYCDGLSKQLNRAPTKEELLAAIKQYSPTFNGQPVNELTAATQYSKWRAAQGLPRLPRGFGANRPAAPVPSAPTGSAPAPQAAPVTSAQAPAPMQTAMVLPLSAPVAPTPAPIPAAAVPSVIDPTTVPAVAIPPWLRAQQ